MLSANYASRRAAVHYCKHNVYAIVNTGGNKDGEAGLVMISPQLSPPKLNTEKKTINDHMKAILCKYKPEDDSLLNQKKCVLLVKFF